MYKNTSLLNWSSNVSCTGLGRLTTQSNPLVVGWVGSVGWWVGLDRVTQNGPMDNPGSHTLRVDWYHRRAAPVRRLELPGIVLWRLSTSELGDTTVCCFLPEFSYRRTCRGGLITRRKTAISWLAPAACDVTAGARASPRPAGRRRGADGDDDNCRDAWSRLTDFVC